MKQLKDFVLMSRILNHVAALSGIRIETELDIMFKVMGVFGTLSHNGAYMNPDLQDKAKLAAAPDHIKELMQRELILVNFGSMGAASGGYNESNFISFLFHELGHATGHTTRLNRGYVNDIARRNCRTSCCLEELVAEATATKLLHHFGLNTEKTEKFTLSYIEMQLKGIPVEMHEFALTYSKIKSQQAMDYILQNWMVGFDIAAAKAA